MDLGWITRSPLAQLPLGDPEAIALSFEDEHHLAYGELLRRQSELANGLRALGVERGDRVGILMRNNPEYLPLHFAIARLGAISVRLNFRLTAPELRFALEDSGCKALCTEPGFAARLEPIAAAVPVETIVMFGEAAPTSLDLVPATALAAHGDADPDLPIPAGEDPLMLMYTSGTTGFPKAAVWTHDTAIGSAASQALEFGFGPDTVAMTTGPLYHAGSFEVLLLPALLLHGRAICIASGDFDIAPRGRDRDRRPGHRPDALPLHGLRPAATRRRRRRADARPTPHPHRRRPDRAVGAGGGGAALPRRRHRPGLRPHRGAPVDLSAGRRLAAEHPGSIGRPFPLERGESRRCERRRRGPGEVGEIWIRGPGTTRGILASARGDGGHLQRGRLAAHRRRRPGRRRPAPIAAGKKDMIRSGAENISPAEVEAALTTHPQVEEAAVIAIPDAEYSEVGCAVLVLSQGFVLDPAAINAYCRERLAGYKCPKRYVAVAELPRNAERQGPEGTDARGLPRPQERAGILIAPSRRIVSPFRYWLATICEASSAYSSGSPSRLGSGDRFGEALFLLLWQPTQERRVHQPGAIVQTRTPRPARSRAAQIVSATTPPLLAA